MFRFVTSASDSSYCQNTAHRTINAILTSHRNV